ncbi:MAG TPA: hypothetical protein V6D47_07300 [Oscillatoriaceae cyanobacterium]
MSNKSGWMLAFLLLAFLLGITFAEGLSGRCGIDGASMIPHEDALYGPAPVQGPLPGRGGVDSTPETYSQPWDSLAWSELRSGRLPLWQPYNAFGKPLLASAQSAPFNPLKLLFWWHGARGVAEAWYLVLRLALAGIGALLLAKKLGLRPLGGALCAAGFMLNGNFVYHFQYPETGSMVMAPWLMLAAEYFLDAPALRRAVIFGSAMGLTALMGHPEPALLATCAAGAAAAVGLVRFQHPIRGYGLLAFAIMLSIGFASCTILPFLELVHSSESYLFHSTASWQPSWGYSYGQKLAMLFSHAVTGTALRGMVYNPAVGTLALALVPIGLWDRKLRRPAVALLAVATLSFIFGLPGQYIRLWSNFLPHSPYMVGLIALALALFGGAGLDRLALAPRRFAPIAMTSVLVLVAFRILVLGGGLVGARVFLLTAGVVICALAMMCWRPLRALPLLLLGSAAFQLFWTAHLANPAQPKFTYPISPIVRYLSAQPELSRTAGELRALIPDSNVMYRLDSIESNEVFNIRRYTEYMDATNGYASANFLKIGLNTSFNRDLLSLANVKYLLVPDPQPTRGPMASYPILMRQGHLALRENPNALPRAWVSYGADFVPDESAATKRLRATPSRWLTRVLLETPKGNAPPTWHDTTSAITPVRFLTRGSQDVTLEATLTHPGWIVLSDIYYPGWKASVDGQPAQILPADVAFRAVFLTPGTHRVEFRYASRTVALGFGITMLALLVSLGLVFVRPARAKQAQEPHFEAA